MSVPIQPVSVSYRCLRRSLLMLLACFGLALAACMSTSKSSERYVVLESHKFT
jgi:hypothetical protein